MTASPPYDVYVVNVAQENAERDPMQRSARTPLARDLYEHLREIEIKRAACDCPADGYYPFDMVDCPVHGEQANKDAAAEQQAEIDAENAWLRAAENPWPPDPPDYEGW